MKSTTHVQLTAWKRFGIDENENHMIKLITWMKCQHAREGTIRMKCNNPNAIDDMGKIQHGFNIGK